MARFSMALILLLALGGSDAVRKERRSRSQKRVDVEAESQTTDAQVASRTEVANATTAGVMLQEASKWDFPEFVRVTMEGVPEEKPTDQDSRSVPSSGSAPADIPTEEIAVMAVSGGALASIVVTCLMWHLFKAVTDCGETTFTENVPAHAYLILFYSFSAVISCMCLARHSTIENVAAFGLISQAQISCYGGVADAASVVLERRMRAVSSWSSVRSSWLAGVDSLMRARIMAAVNMMWLFPLFWFGMPQLCKFVGISSTAVTLACRIGTLSGLCMMQSSATFVFLWGRGFRTAVTVMLLLGNAVHLAATYYFIAMLGMGVDGYAYGLIISSVAMYVFGLLYAMVVCDQVNGTEEFKETPLTLTMIWWCTDETLDVSSTFYKDFRAQFLNTIPMNAFFTAWIFIVALLGPQSLAAAVIAENIRRTFVNIFTMAAKTASVLFCATVQSGQVEPAQGIMNYGALFTVATWTVFGVHLFFTAHYWAQVYTPQDVGVQRAVASLLLLVAFTGFGSAIHEFAGYMASGIGMSKTVFAVHVVVYVVVGIPAAWKLSQSSMLNLLGAFVTLAGAEGLAAAVLLGVLSAVDLRLSGNEMACKAKFDSKKGALLGPTTTVPPLLPAHKSRAMLDTRSDRTSRTGSNRTIRSPSPTSARGSPGPSAFPHLESADTLEARAERSWESLQY